VSNTAHPAGGCRRSSGDRRGTHRSLGCAVVGRGRLNTALAGPVARGDEATGARQRAALAGRAPDLVGLFDELAARTRDLAATPAPVTA